MDQSLKTVSKWIEHYMNVHSAGKWEYSTRVGYEHVVNKWVNPLFGRTTLVNLKYEQIEMLYSQIQKAGYSRSTLNQIHSLLRPAFAEAVRRGYIPFNPIDQVSLPKKSKTTPVYLTHEETRKVLAEASRQNELASWGIALGMGLRQGERLALKWTDLDLDSPSPHLTVRHTLQRQKGKGLVLKKPKTSKSQRTLALTPEMVAALKQRRAIQNSERLNEKSYLALLPAKLALRLFCWLNYIQKVLLCF
jgi:integrase